LALIGPDTLSVVVVRSIVGLGKTDIGRLSMGDVGRLEQPKLGWNEERMMNREKLLERVVQGAREVQFGFTISIDVESDDEELVDEVVRQAMEQVAEQMRPLVEATWALNGWDYRNSEEVNDE
jgi:hypothetical protein